MRERVTEGCTESKLQKRVRREERRGGRYETRILLAMVREVLRALARPVMQLLCHR